MVSRCRAAGVDVYVDAVINHMTGVGSGTGYAGSPINPMTILVFMPLGTFTIVAAMEMTTFKTMAIPGKSRTASWSIWLISIPVRTMCRAKLLTT